MFAKILIVDDEENIAFSLEFLLRKKGHQTFIAKDGESAINIAMQVKPDIVLLDINLPKKNGYQVCKELLQKQNLSTKIIFLSAKCSEDEIEKGMALGAVDYITKPFSTEELTQKIANLITKRKD